jgi:hypothetical protein
VTTVFPLANGQPFAGKLDQQSQRGYYRVALTEPSPQLTFSVEVTHAIGKAAIAFVAVAAGHCPSGVLNATNDGDAVHIVLTAPTSNRSTEMGSVTDIYSIRLSNVAAGQYYLTVQSAPCSNSSGCSTATYSVQGSFVCMFVVC